MSFKKIQQDVHEFTAQFEPQYWKPHEMLAALMEETGEIAREINAQYGPKKKKPTEEKNELSEEIADAVFALCCIANSLNMDLDTAWEKKMAKIRERDHSRFQRKDSSKID